MPGWTYEGWIVWQGDPEVWISYGKFRPDETGLLSSRDDTGTGPFGGTEDFRNAGVEDVPGEEWTSDEIAVQLGIDLPGDFTLPLALDSVDAAGKVMWHHVISIEPAFDLVEGPVEGKPFVVRPYENEIGEGGPGVPRTILMVREPPTGSRLAILLVVLVALGCWLRFFDLTGQSLWYDETVSVHLTGKAIPDLVAHTAGDIHPPGYYLIKGQLLSWVAPAEPWSECHADDQI